MGIIDKECQKLCNALSQIEGVDRINASYAHSFSTFLIFFRCNDSRQLFPLIRQINHNYSNRFNWKCHAELTDVEDSPIVFMLHSGQDTPPEVANFQADEIADGICEFLENRKVMDAFGIKHNENYSKNIITEKNGIQKLPK